VQKYPKHAPKMNFLSKIDKIGANEPRAHPLVAFPNTSRNLMNLQVANLTVMVLFKF
jgi:hypothetical protein